MKMKILYILIFSVLVLNPSLCQNGNLPRRQEEGKVYSATSDLSGDAGADADGSLLNRHPRSIRPLDRLASLRDKRILPKKNRLTDFLHVASEFGLFLYLLVLLCFTTLCCCCCFCSWKTCFLSVERKKKEDELVLRETVGVVRDGGPFTLRMT